jgi:uroporphyrinogen decarboxylase
MTTGYDFLEACWGRPVSRTPVWIMRQAGRYLPQYREVRSRVSFLELCKNPELAAAVTLQPVEALGVDAAILFSDILIPVESMGVGLDFKPGPVLDKPVASEDDIDALRIPCMEEEVSFVLETIRILRSELTGRVPLIGFCGGPFTLACYMVEGQGSKDFSKIKQMMFRSPELFRLLMGKITETNIRYLNAQIAAGVQAVQVFDTWGGLLSPSDYETYILPFTRKLIAGLNRRDVPVILFVRGAGTMLDLVQQAGADVIGLDWHIALDRARSILGTEVAVQGNLDPSVLFGPKAVIEKGIRRILGENNNRSGHIFNLGHGVLPGTPVENVQFLVDKIHQLSSI